MFKVIISVMIVLGFSVDSNAGVKPGELRLNTGPKVLVTYTNFYNDSDLRATCVIYSDGSAMFLADGIAPYRKPKFVQLSQKELASVRKTVRAVTSSLTSSKDFSGYNAIPLGEDSDGKLGALYYGKGSENGPRPELDLAVVPEKSELGDLVRALCGYGEDL